VSPVYYSFYGTTLVVRVGEFLRVIDHPVHPLNLTPACTTQSSSLPSDFITYEHVKYTENTRGGSWWQNYDTFRVYSGTNRSVG
jgi:hypothetical protein